MDQGVDADPAKSWGPWKHAVWRTEDIAEASNLVDLLYYLFAFVDHFRTRLDQSMAKKANAAAEGLCKFVFWTAKRCEFKKSHTCDRDVMSPLKQIVTEVGAMVMYHEASKIVKPKMDYLKVPKVDFKASKIQTFEFRHSKPSKYGRYRKQSSTKLALSWLQYLCLQ